MSRKENIVVIFITLLLYIVNQLVKTKIDHDLIRYVCVCYYNDIIGSVTFIAYCNVVLSFRKRAFDTLFKIEIVLFIAGLFWEYITPLFRSNTTTDIWDIVAYLIGGFIYWLIYKVDNLFENNNIY